MRGKQHIRSLDQDPRTALALIGLELALDHGLEARARPLRLEQEIMGAMQRAQALGQGLGHGLGRTVGGLAQARLHQRLHDGEHVLDPVVELADQHGLALRRAPPLGHVAEDQHGAGKRAVEAENWRAGILDGQLLVVAGEEQSAGLKPGGGAFAQSAERGIVERLAALLVDDAEHFPNRLAAGVGERPAGELLGDLVEQKHAPRGVGGDHALADAADGGAQPFPLTPELDQRLVAGAIGPAHGVDRGPGEGREHDDARHGENGERGGAIVVARGFRLTGEPADDERQHEDARQEPAQHFAGRRLLDDCGGDPLLRRSSQQPDGEEQHAQQAVGQTWR